MFAAICGGPGTGKTTLVAEYFAGSEATILAWYTMSAQDSDPVVFIRNLVSTLKRSAPDLSKTAVTMVDSLGERGAAQAMALLCDELAAAGKSVLLVIDDIQRASAEPAMRGALDNLAQGFCSAGQLVMVGRTLPPIEIPRLQMSGQVLVVEEDELRFTLEEEAELWELIHGSAPPVETLDLMRAATGGWPAGFALLAHKGELSSDPRVKPPEFLASYFSNEVMAGLEPDFGIQLMAAAFLPKWDTTCLSETFGERGAEFFEQHLGAIGTFIDRSSSQITCQPLFREFLQEAFEAQVPLDKRNGLYRKLASSSWLPEDESIALWVRARAWHEAARATKRAASQWFDTGRHQTVRQALDRFLESWKESSAELCYIEGELARREGRLAESVTLLKRADQLATNWQENALTRAEILGALAAAQTARGEPDADSARRALELLQAPGESASKEAERIEAFCENVLGIVALGSGDLDKAEQSLKRALKIHSRLEEPAGLIRIRHNLGLVAARSGDFQRALSHYRESIRQAEAAGRYPLPLSYNNLALALLYLGRYQEAWDAASRGIPLATQLGFQQDLVFLQWTLGMLSLHGNEPEKSLEFFEASLGGALAIGDRQGAATAHLGLAELALRQADPVHAQVQIEYALERMEADLDDPRMIEATMLQAEIEIRSGQLPAGQARLGQIENWLVEHPDSYRSFHLARLLRDARIAQGETTLAAQSQADLEGLAARFGYALDAKGSQDSPEPLARPELIVRALGKFEVQLNGKQLSARDWRTSKTRVLLMFLLLNPSGASKETLLDLLFGQQDPGRSAIHTVVSRLRNGLEPDLNKETPSRFVLLVEGRYVFNQGISVFCDVLEFQGLIRRARAPDCTPVDRSALLADAMALYGGPFMAGAQEGEWPQLEAERLRRLAAEAFEDLFVLAAGDGDWPRLEQLADAHITADPQSQLAYRMKLLAQAMQDRFGDARRLGDLLLSTLTRTGRIPEDETLELVERIADESLTVRQAQGFLPDR